MLRAIDAAQTSIRLETYIYADDRIGREFMVALLRARQRSVQVSVLIDALGSHSLPTEFFSFLKSSGAQVRFFNPLSLNRLAIRDHRKLLTCDGKLGFIGGFNISMDYDGDGKNQGWCDLGMMLEGEVVRDLTQSFDEIFALADFQHKRIVRLRPAPLKRTIEVGKERLLLGGPGRGLNPIRRSLYRDLAHAGNALIAEAYFLPTWKLRSLLTRIARRGGEVELILAGKSDVGLSRLAGRSLYRRLLRNRIKIYEYQPQILHAKLIILDDIVYVGSANLDPRSLSINYEFMMRFQNAAMAEEGRAIFRAMKQESIQINLDAWRKSRSFWTRLKERLAYYLLVRIDPEVARQQWRALPDAQELQRVRAKR